jgi:hypothetical protein
MVFPSCGIYVSVIDAVFSSLGFNFAAFITPERKIIPNKNTAAAFTKRLVPSNVSIASSIAIEIIIDVDVYNL